MIRYASCVWELPMPTTFRAYQPDQPLLLPPDLQEWVPPGHLSLPFIPSCLPTTARLSGTDIILSQWIL